MLIGGFLVPEPGPRSVARSRCPGVRPLRDLQRRIYPTRCSDRDPSHGGRSFVRARAGGAAIGSFATLWALSNLGISGTMWIAAGIAGVGVVSYTAPELGAGACTRPSGCELTAIILPMSDIPFHTSPLTWSSRSAG